ncbi:TOBE domain-containing protein, partial [Candidatus Caldatribacterium sp.]|uniref:TOBE domain-containing protein n=1 Tax=Candidatus Caldatribacterium sp. TaxID=2282143 RepID=UPI00299CCF21|nr:TOBE domain-containing protein [Candidatus Caldatribacterium sp.]MDW8082140.1 TOBE domain-containing protein [Candidatus Calescibacterium sp.]
QLEGRLVGTEVTLGVRPQHVEVKREKQDKNAIAGVVKVVEFQGDKTVLTVRLEDEAQTDAKAVVPARECFAEGDIVWFFFAPPVIRVFEEEKLVL